MKTKADLTRLIPIITEEIANRQHDFSVGINDRAANYYCYQEDGWCIEVFYDCTGEWHYDPGDYWTPVSEDLISAFGEVTDIIAYHYDDDTEEQTLFDDDDIRCLWSAIDKALVDIS